MSRILTHTISAGLIGTGVVAWAFASRPLMTDSELKTPLNPLGINGSPYGQVFAMAMQGPIDTYFDSPAGGHVHHHDEDCDHDHEHDAAKKPAPPSLPLADRLKNLLTSLDKASIERTNPKAASSAQRLYIRRQVEDKLRFAYQLDPSHYGNYNSLHFFLTEPELGTRPQLTASAAKLAEDTIQYCLKQNDDPRPLLTASGACTNIVELMIKDRRYKTTPTFTTTQMRQYLDLMGHCLNRYVATSQEWDRSKSWDNLSPQRIEECAERFHFITKIRETQVATVQRFERESNTQASN